MTTKKINDRESGTGNVCQFFHFGAKGYIRLRETNINDEIQAYFF